MEFEGIPDDDVWNIDFSDLTFEKQIARGSFGKVYKGNYLGIPVAIKSILRHDDPAYIKYVEREISVLKGIRHPYIVGFCGVSTDGNGLYIVTEFIDGGDVRALIKKGNLSWGQRIQITNDLAKAIYYLHTKKIIHRDLKSKNLLMGSDNRVRLCDFGFARTTDIMGQRAMTICGTPGFVAPEIMMGRDYDGQCDVFSFGNVLAELITLQRPGKDFWLRSTADEYQLDLSQLSSIAPKDCPPSLLDLAIACCQYYPSDRPHFADILKLLKGLETKYPINAKDKGDALGTSPTSPVNSPLTQHNTLRSPTLDVNFAHLTMTENIQAQRVHLSSTEIVITDRHLSKMVQRATNPDMFDLEFVDDFLLTYPCFAKPSDVMNALTTRLHNLQPEMDASDTYKAVDVAEREKRMKLSQIRILIFLNGWIEKYVDDFSEPDMDEASNNFLLAASERVSEKELEIWNVEKMVTKSRGKRTKRASWSQVLPKPLDVFMVVSISSTQIAQQITFILQNSYKCINPREFLKDMWKKRQDCGVASFLSDSKKITYFTASAIVKGENKEQRAQLIGKFIEIANHCLTLKNFQGFFAILNGIQHPSVERLKETLQAVKPNHIQLWKTFKTVSSKEDHYSNYKEKQQSTVSPTIPFLEPYLEELSYVDSYYPDIAKGGVIHFAKHRKIARTVRLLVQYSRDATYPELTNVYQINNLVMCSQLLEEDGLSKASLSAESPASFLI
eukprot:TRINITY_DN2309_c1_g2_i1.p1 TRINITY_DN2309_c1_g2~~TRINITY_DN2309_c1_g2_i1.p1  ORF type:complete len:729 (-),score=217.35 TRINITY_DN2309_c1_g2_i1:57-2243(-)